MARRSVAGVIVFLSAALLLAGAVSARADPFYLRYDADEVYPEDAGWERHTTDPYGLLVRGLDSGIFTIDSRASPYISDFYRRDLGDFGPGPGETVTVTWRMRVPWADASDYEADPKVLISNGASEYVEFFVGTDFVAVDEDGLLGPEHLYEFDPCQWRTFSFVSADLEHYELYVDGALAFTGALSLDYIGGPNRVTFGDTFIGFASLSEWDYLEVAVVPEAASAPLALTAMAFCAHLRRRQS
jgi:hypothetical protein